MRQESFTCDVCGDTKGAGNRWLMGWVVRGGFAISDWGFAPDNVERVYHLCSEACALAEQGKHLRRDRRLEELKRPVEAEVRVMPMGSSLRVG